MRDDRPNTPRIVVVGLSRCSTELFSFLAISPTIIIARALLSHHLLKKLPENADLTLDSVVISDNAFERMYFVDVAREGGLGIMELGLDLREKWCGG